MNVSNNSKQSRRGILKSTLGLLVGGLVGPLAEKAEAQPALQHVNRFGNPSQLKIADMRYTVVKKPGPSPCPIIRIDTNQGVYGLGEVRDVANYQYAMVLKSRIIGENPLNVDYLFEKIAHFGGISRQAGGVVAVEMALWDIPYLPTTRRQVARQDSRLRGHARSRPTTGACGDAQGAQRPAGDVDT